MISDHQHIGQTVVFHLPERACAALATKFLPVFPPPSCCQSLLTKLWFTSCIFCVFAWCHTALLMAVSKDHHEAKLSMGEAKQATLRHLPVQPLLLLRLQFSWTKPFSLPKHNALSCR